MSAMSKASTTCPRKGAVRVVARGGHVFVLVDDVVHPGRPAFVLGHARRLSDALIRAGENARAIRLARTSKRTGGAK